MGSAAVLDDLLLTRFPEISFVLSLEQVDPLPLQKLQSGKYNAITDKGFLYPEQIDQEIDLWKKGLYLEGIDVLYVYGIGLGYHYLALQQWLKEGIDRAVIFFEHDLRVLKTLFSIPEGIALLEDPKVHIQLISEDPNWDEILEESIHRFISDQVDFTTIASYQKGKERKIKNIRLQLLRKSSLMSVAVTELLHYEKLMENISANFTVLPASSHVNAWKDTFSGIPAIICGAGVSLVEVIEQLRQLDNRALIIAGGSAITALHHLGIRPHLCIALDPNEEEYARIKASSCFEESFIYSSRLHKGVLSSTNVRQGYLCADTGGAFESWMHEELGLAPGSLGVELGQEALSVTTLAVPLARHLGCEPILFCGVDLSYQNLQRYPAGVIPSSRVFLEDLEKERRSMEKLVRKKNGEGRFVYTLVKWVMEAACLGAYAKAHEETQFFCSSLSGLPISSVSHLPIEEFANKFCHYQYDLRGRLHLVMEQTRFEGITNEKVQETFSKLARSLQDCIPLVEQMIAEIERKHAEPFYEGMSPESGKMQVLQMDIMEQMAYEVCLSSILYMYRKILERRYPNSLASDTEKGYRQTLAKEKKIWEECLLVIESCLYPLQKESYENAKS